MVENIYELKYEQLDKKVKEKMTENKEKFKTIDKERIEEKIKENSIKMEIERLIKNIEENNNIKTSIIMKEMYKQGFIDGVNLIINCVKS